MKKYILNVVLVFVIYMIFSLLFDFLHTRVNFGDYEIIANIFETIVCCGVPLFIFRKDLKNAKALVKKVGLKNFVLDIIRGGYIPRIIVLILDLLLIMIFMFIETKNNPGVDNTEVVKESIQLVTFLGTIIGACIVAPIFEELLFRKYMLDKSDETNQNKFLLLSSLLFGLIHYTSGIMAIVSAFITGYILGKNYLKYRNIKANIIIHGFINFILSLSFFALFLKIPDVIINTFDTILLFVAFVILIFDIKNMSRKKLTT